MNEPRRYSIVRDSEIVFQNDSAVETQTWLREYRCIGDAIITWDGTCLRGHDEHELAWDASAEKSGLSPQLFLSKVWP